MNDTLLAVAALVLSAMSFVGLVISLFFRYWASHSAHTSASISQNQERTSKIVERIKIHREFQATFRDLQKRLPDSVNDNDWVPSKEDLRTVKLYWYLVFDEWFVTKSLDSYYQSLWDDYYSIGAMGGMRIPVFRAVFQEMVEKDTVFLGKAEDFLREMDRLNIVHHGTPIADMN